MENLPEGMTPDRHDVVYYDAEKEQFYIVKLIYPDSIYQIKLLTYGET